MIYFLLILIFLTLVFSFLGFLTAQSTAHKKKYPEPAIEDYSNNRHDDAYVKKVREWIASSEYNYIKIKSPYFYNINAFEMTGLKKDRWVILLHGVSVTHVYMMNLAHMYSKLGYSVLAWDSRHHGKSGGDNISYGFYEKNDLKAVVDSIKKTEGRKVKIGVHGVSMGAGILLAYAAQVRDDCDFYIADCPYSDFFKQASAVAGRTIKLPKFLVSVMMFFANAIMRVFYKYDLKQINILEKIHRVENPVLFFSCRNDKYVAPKMTEELYNACGSTNKKIVQFDDGGHAGAFPFHTDEFKNTVVDFLKSCDF